MAALIVCIGRGDIFHILCPCFRTKYYKHLKSHDTMYRKSSIRVGLFMSLYIGKNNRMIK